MSKTTIQISTATRDKLKKLKITKLETYDEIINRLIGDYLNAKKEKTN